MTRPRAIPAKGWPREPAGPTFQTIGSARSAARPSRTSTWSSSEPRRRVGLRRALFACRDLLERLALVPRRAEIADHAADNEKAGQDPRQGGESRSGQQGDKEAPEPQP